MDPDPNQPNESRESRRLAALDPQFRKEWAASRRVVRIIMFVLGLGVLVVGILIYRTTF